MSMTLKSKLLSAPVIDGVECAIPSYTLQDPLLIYQGLLTVKPRS